MSKELKSYLMLALLACIWGSSFILMKRGMEKKEGLPIYFYTQIAFFFFFFSFFVHVCRNRAFVGCCRNAEQSHAFFHAYHRSILFPSGTEVETVAGIADCIFRNRFTDFGEFEVQCQR